MSISGKVRAIKTTAIKRSPTRAQALIGSSLTCISYVIVKYRGTGGFPSPQGSCDAWEFLRLSRGVPPCHPLFALHAGCVGRAKMSRTPAWPRVGGAWCLAPSALVCVKGGSEMGKTSSSIRYDGLQGDRLPFRWAAPLMAMLVIASWVSVIGVACLGRLAVSYLAGI